MTQKLPSRRQYMRWTPERVDALRQMAEVDGMTWKQIAAKFQRAEATIVSAAFRHGISSTHGNVENPWPPEDDAQLVELAKTHRAGIVPGAWSKVAVHFAGRSKSAVRSRYFRLEAKGAAPSLPKLAQPAAPRTFSFLEGTTS